MNFMEAVEQIKQGKKVTRSFLVMYIDNEDCLYSETDKRKITHLSMNHINATDWKVVEENKTLWDKKFKIAMIYNEKEGLRDRTLLKADDVKEKLKEFLKYLQTEEESACWYKAKEIFGKGLL